MSRETAGPRVYQVTRGSMPDRAGRPRVRIESSDRAFTTTPTAPAGHRDSPTMARTPHRRAGERPVDPEVRRPHPAREGPVLSSRLDAGPRPAMASESRAAGQHDGRAKRGCGSCVAGQSDFGDPHSRRSDRPATARERRAAERQHLRSSKRVFKGMTHWAAAKSDTNQGRGKSAKIMSHRSPRGSQ